MLRELREKDMSGCAISAMMSEAGRRFSGDAIIRSIAVMHERSSGLGGGFAAYGIYPEYAGKYAFHTMYDSREAQEAARGFLVENCIIAHEEPVPIRPSEAIRARPILHRYFLGKCPVKHRVEKLETGTGIEQGEERRYFSGRNGRCDGRRR